MASPNTRPQPPLTDQATLESTPKTEIHRVDSGIEDYFSLQHYTSTASKPQRASKPTHNAAMRDIIKGWASVSPSPPGCRAICSSSWTRFDPTQERRKSSEEMRLSRLWGSHPTTPDFNPPPSERIDLGVDAEKLAVPGEQLERRERTRNNARNHRRKKSSLHSSWSTESEDGNMRGRGQSKSSPVAFIKQPIKSMSTSSLLTASLQSSRSVSRKNSEEEREDSAPAGTLARHLKEMNVTASMLPSAFESDSEDENESGDENEDGN